MELQEELEKMRVQIHADSYSVSIGEWISLYEKDEVDIHLDRLKLSNWDNTQKTQFIESILLGIPLPPIVVLQRSDGVWNVLDGLQRLYTIYQFVGILKDEKGNLLPPLVLEGTKFLPSLKGKKWDDPDDPENSLDMNQRFYIKRTNLRVNILLMENDDIAKYEAIRWSRFNQN